MENKRFEKSIENCNQITAVSMHDFLDFLKLTCQVHESILVKDTDENHQMIDYNALAKNDLVNSLIALNLSQSPKAEMVEDNRGGMLW